MTENIKIVNMINEQAFPNTDYRFALVSQKEDGTIIMERDFLGENSLHYYIISAKRELVVASTIADLKAEIEGRGETFVWEHARAVSGNTKVTLDEGRFLSANPLIQESQETLQEYKLPNDGKDLVSTGRIVHALLARSLEQRLSSIPETEIGLLLSGGLDSMSIGYLLSLYSTNRKTTAFTLKVNDYDSDIVKSRELAKTFCMDLVEVKIEPHDDEVKISLERYTPDRQLVYQRTVAQGVALNGVVKDVLTIGSNPKKDNVYCAIAMHLIAPAIKQEGIDVVFCGEGPNEMFNDYGFDPLAAGYGTHDKGDVKFREALTFGLKTTDLQMGRGGLAKHALSRMGKIFAPHNIRLESPYFDKNIAKILCNVPHTTSYDVIKQHVMSSVLGDPKLSPFIWVTAKEKFQDGSGISQVVREFDQNRLLDMFEQIYGIRKTSYLA